MKKILVILALIGIAAGPARSPKDVATHHDKAMVRTNAIRAVVPPAPVAALMPKLVVVTNRPLCWPNCTNSQVRHNAMPFTWRATNGVHFSTYVFLQSTNLKTWTLADDLTDELGRTNSVFIPDGMMHTTYINFNYSLPCKFYRLDVF